MTNANKATFWQAFTTLARCCRAFAGPKGARDTRDAANAYWTALVDLPIDALISSADTLARHETRMPTAAEWHAKAEAVALAEAELARPPARIPTDSERRGIMEARREFYTLLNASRIGNWKHKPVDLDAIDRRPILVPSDR